MRLEKENLSKSQILKGAYKRTTQHRKLPELKNTMRNPFTDTVKHSGLLLPLPGSAQCNGSNIIIISKEQSIL